MTTVANLIEKLKQYPPDATVVAYDADAGRLAAVSGFLFSPAGRYLTADNGGEDVVEGPIVEICTDDS